MSLGHKECFKMIFVYQERVQGIPRTLQLTEFGINIVSMLTFCVKVEKYLSSCIIEKHMEGVEIYEIHRNLRFSVTKIEFLAPKTLQNDFLIPGTFSEGPTYLATNWVCDKTS